MLDLKNHGAHLTKITESQNTLHNLNLNYVEPYKVRVAKNPLQRLHSYQTSDLDHAFSLGYSMKTPIFRETESHTHEIFPNQHE